MLRAAVTFQTAGLTGGSRSARHFPFENQGGCTGPPILWGQMPA